MRATSSRGVEKAISDFIDAQDPMPRSPWAWRRDGNTISEFIDAQNPEPHPAPYELLRRLADSICRNGLELCGFDYTLLKSDAVKLLLLARTADVSTAGVDPALAKRVRVATQGIRRHLQPIVDGVPPQLCDGLPEAMAGVTREQYRACDAELHGKLIQPCDELREGMSAVEKAATPTTKPRTGGKPGRPPLLDSTKAADDELIERYKARPARMKKATFINSDPRNARLEAALAWHRRAAHEPATKTHATKPRQARD